MARHEDRSFTDILVGGTAQIKTLQLGGDPANGTDGGVSLGDLPLQLKTPGAADAAGAVLLGGGTTAAPCASAVADDKFVELRCKTTATSGDNRLMYLRYAMDGINATGGECLRAFTTMGAVCGTARGAHVSLILGAAGRTTGTGVGLQGTLQVPAGTNTGKLGAVLANIWLDSADAMTMPAEHGILLLEVDGDATQKAAVKYAINLAGVQATAASSGVADMVTTGAADATSNTRIKIRINGTDYWLLATSAAPSA